jgi:probable F420-dependent oxidoreductase
MRVGVIYPQIELGGDPESARIFGLAVEQLSFNHLLAYDHVLGADPNRKPPLWGPYTHLDPFHDPFVLFSYLAGATDRLCFATGVLVLPQRQTVLVAKQAADLDLLSGERLRLGVGVGWNPVEYTALGQDFKNRGARLDEQIGILRKLWAEPVVDVTSTFHRIERAGLLPRPRRQIPIWIGGFSEAAFQRGAAFGDGFIFSHPVSDAKPSVEYAIEALSRVRLHASRLRRNLTGFGLDLTTFGEPASEVVLAAEKWRDTGGSHLSIGTMGLGLDSVQAHIDFIAEVRTRLVAADLV